MGHFFAASAFRGVAVDSVADAIVRFADSHGVSSTLHQGGAASEECDAMLYEPQDGWVTVIWPVYFNIHDVRACAAVSAELLCLAATVNVYDGDFWSMEFLDEGRLVDQAAPAADYFADDDDSAADLRHQWQGHPEVVGALLGVPATVIAPYFAYLGQEDAPGKAFPDDEATLDDFWVFADLWRRLGIPYPSDPGAFSSRVRFAKRFGDKLPSWEGGPL